MMYLLTFEKYNFSDVSYTRRDREYFFESENWSYKVSVSKNDSNASFPYVGFKAKKIGDLYFNYDMSVITNDNVYKVMDTIREILNYDYDNHDNKGYKFSFIGDKIKSKQRLNLYTRILPNNWNFNYDENNNQYFLTKEKNVKTFERYSDETHDLKLIYDYDFKI